ncbi:hypothetical protein DAEQUDRAFT_736635 [Daedalea quercina L-15889]|uniref:F-box domain-containing protein n=1 Tax=Daedalea quercina L-15889 TaxID=1314783 RepID=A0A165SDM1_9APHY|nr:hypothetical protein DAEQUDRAFT_736635 [Daedalea quercina L-15889]
MAPRKKVALERSSEDAQPPAPTPPKKDGGRRNLRGKRGGLRDMPNMPLDILMEPRDLLNLARTSKPFRELLMSRGSARMWKTARAIVDGLPECPEHLSEPAYANLAFFAHCHNCLKPNVQTILWEFGVRYCPTCVKILTVSRKDMRLGDRHQWAFHLSYDCIFSKIRTNTRTEIYHRPELDKLYPIREGLCQDKDQWAKTEAELRKCVYAIKQHAALCHAWDKKRAAHRSAELQDIRQQRLTTVVSKLRELGWGDELDRIASKGYRPLCEHPQVRLSKPLTNRGWSNIQTEVVTQMEETKQNRLRAERRVIIYKRVCVLKSVITAARTAPPKRTAADEYKPKCRDLAMMPEVRKLIEVPNDAVVDQESLQAVIPMLPALEERWQQERKADLAAMWANEAEAQDGADVLDLAAVLFQCKECKRYLDPPKVLAHECPTIPYLCESKDVQYEDYYRCVFEACDGKQPWSASNFRLPRKLDEIRALLEKCGKDLKVVTQKELDAANLKLTYDEPHRGRMIMTWRRAIRHMYEVVYFNVSHWRVATDEEQAAVKEREDNRIASHRASRLRYGNLRCGYCDISRWEGSWSSGFPLEKLKVHLKDKHAVENPTAENGDMYLHPDDDSSELDPIRIKKLQYEDVIHDNPWMDLDYDDLDLDF